MDFCELGLSDKVRVAVQLAGYETPTPIQSLAIPAAVSGQDVLGIAQTGTGKTGAFILPLLHRLEKGRTRARMPRAVIIEPTRELAAQVVQSLDLLNTQHKLTVTLLIGGVSYEDQYRKLDKGADILIATPGRLLDHFERGKLLLSSVEYLVIDEADRLLDAGFIPDIEQICKRLPSSRQTLLFSATMPVEIQRLVEIFLVNPKQVKVSPASSTAATVEQSLIAAPSEPKLKRELLRTLIRSAENLKNAIIFCNRKRDVALLFRSLQKHEFDSFALHGDMNQTERAETLEKFRNSAQSLLVASDIAARGLDIQDISHVFNFDVPTHAEDYVHRIGRTGRAGRVGTAITLVTPENQKHLRALEEVIQNKIEWRESLSPQCPPPKEEQKKGRSRSRETAKRKTSAPVVPENSSCTVQAVAPNAKDSKKTKDSAVATMPSNTRKSQSSEKEETVVGLGSHVPAFLLLEIPVTHSTDSTD